MTDHRVPTLGYWCDKAACKGMSELFNADYAERYNKKIVRERRAKIICSTCPVILECRAYARANPEYGVWGGETEDERYDQGFPVPVGSRADRNRRLRSQRKKEADERHVAKT